MDGITEDLSLHNDDLKHSGTQSQRIHLLPECGDGK